jgi:hypothetical protein
MTCEDSDTTFTLHVSSRRRRRHATASSSSSSALIFAAAGLALASYAAAPILLLLLEHLVPNNDFLVGFSTFVYDTVPRWISHLLAGWIAACFGYVLLQGAQAAW